MNPKRKELVEGATEFIREMNDVAFECTKVKDCNLDWEVRSLSYDLYNACFLTSESILILIGHSKEWDADILLRTVLEGTLKFTYLLRGSKEEQSQRRFEYQESLFDVLQVRDNVALKELLTELSGKDEIFLRPLKDTLLSDEFVNDVNSKFPNRTKAELTKKWSVTGMLASFKSDPHEGYQKLVYLHRDYSMKSHVAHLDSIGLGVMKDRAMRDSVRKEAVTNSHSANLASSICTLASIKTRLLLEAHGLDKRRQEVVDDKFGNLFKLIDELGKVFTKVEYGTD